MTFPDALPQKVAREDASLRMISLQDLANGVKSSQNDLLRACTELGFFYLDCRDFDSGKVMERVQDMYSLGTSFFDLSQQEKSQWQVEEHGEHLVMG